MNAMTEPVHFQMPKKPRVFIKDPLPDQRKVVVMPIKAVFDERLHHGSVRVLAALCSYCNRAGITWVSQTRLAKELNITQQAVAKQFKQLRELGYLETVSKGFKGERTDTLRVIFDKSVDAETAMAVTSSIEDTRSPQIKQEQARQADVIDKEGQARVALAISKVLKQQTKKELTMPKQGDTRTVKEMKAAIKKAQTKQQQPVDNHAYMHNPQVVIVDTLHSQLNHNLQVVHIPKEHKEIGIKEVDILKEADMSVLHNQEVEELIAGGLTAEQISESLDILLPLYQAEGITPTSGALMAGIRQLVADTR